MDEMEDQVEMREHMPFLESLARNASLVLEIGCGWGNGSTRAFSRGLTDGWLISVDFSETHPEERPGIRWNKVLGRSEDVSTREEVEALLAGVRPDVIFIDTDHTKEQMEKELAVWSALAGPGTIWVFHDTWMFGAYNTMTDAIKEFAAENDWVFTDLTQESHGLGLMTKNGWVGRWP